VTRVEPDRYSNAYSVEMTIYEHGSGANPPQIAPNGHVDLMPRPLG